MLEKKQPDFAEPHATALCGLRPARSHSTSCNFAAFCKRCRSPTSPNPTPRPSVASDLRVANQPLACLPLFARGASDGLAPTPSHGLSRHSARALSFNLLQFCRFLQEVCDFRV